MLFIKAMVIGFCIAAPVGPIGMLCIQRSLSRGFRSGLATGLGAACADALYGLLGALGIVGVVAALPALTLVLKIAGGAFLVWLAWSIARESSAAPAAACDVPAASNAREFLTTFALTLSNPLTILSFVAIFAALGPLPHVLTSIEGAGWLAVAPLVAGVFAGSAAWWLCLSGATAALRVRMPASFVRGITRLSALVVTGFGVVQVIAGLYSLAQAV